ncbi:deoxycytidylate deaminase [Pilobolus umbonatus]|nr:deoxycytidylate deaminase [Pilobolus umbonatus]
MFIGITGPRSSGKHTVAEYLIQSHKFELLILNNKIDTFQRDHLYDGARKFNTITEMQDYVLHHWQGNFVSCDLDRRDLWQLKKRPYFLLVSVEAPITMRYHRYKTRCHASKRKPMNLEEFLIDNDLTLYNASIDNYNESRTTPLYNMMVLSDIIITNSYPDKNVFSKALDLRDLTNLERLRPSWDTYFMLLSDLAARRSNCMKRRVGCILVKDFRVIATGYNGTPRGLKNCNEGGCSRCNDGSPCGTGLDRCLCMHAEENALLEAGRVYSKGVILYCNTCPCLGCAIKIVQTGVREVVYSKSYGMDQMTAKVFSEANVKLRQHSPPSMRIEIKDDIDDVVALLEMVKLSNKK